MTNETARREIESLDYYLQNHTNDYSEESHTAMMMAIKALEQQPCEKCEVGNPCLYCEYDFTEKKTKEPCEDCISRKAVKEMLTEKWTKYMPMELDMNLSFVLEKISELPSVTKGICSRHKCRGDKRK